MVRRSDLVKGITVRSNRKNSLGLDDLNILSFECIDFDSKKGIPGIAYVIEKPDGTAVYKGRTDSKGMVMIKYVEEGEYNIVFPSFDVSTIAFEK